MISVKKILVFAFLMHTKVIQQSKAQANRKPLFDSHQNVVITAYENATVGSSIAVIRASDQEADPIVFSLDAVGGELLNIDNNGNLTLKKALDRETTRQHTFTVIAADQCPGCNLKDRETQKQFYLVVLDINDNTPVFVSTPYLARVAENQTVGHLVIQVSALDKDLGQNAQISYMFSSQTKTDTFAISNHDGKITLNGPLDFENEQRYTLFVTAKDGGSPARQSETTVIVDVSDVSDNPPKFLRSIYLEEIYENKAKGSMVMEVEAVDGDAGVGNEVSYEIISGNDEGLFAIDRSVGNITVNGTVDAERTDFFRITVRASEVVDPSSNSTAVVLITVLDKNDNPPKFLKDSYHFTIRKDLALPGYMVTVQLNVQDKDINVFANETETSEVLWGVAYITVELINVNDNEPAFNQSSYNFTYDEEISVNFAIGTVTAKDADLGSYGEISYELYGNYASSFTVDVNGTIKTSKVLDYENNRMLEFFMLANDGGRFFDASKNYVTKIRVLLRDVNDNNPVFLNAPYTVSIMENQTNIIVVYQMSASDLDSGDNGRVSFNITSGNIGNTFAVNTSGVVSILKILDREIVPSYSLTIMAFDHGIPSRNTTTVLTVTVLDKNDNPPVINGGAYITTNISEAHGGGTVVYRLQVSDKDEGSNKILSYAMISGHNGKFILNSNTGVLQISPTGLDRELHSSYNITINVTDGGQPTLWDSTVLHVTILDINDNSSEFEPSPSESLSTYIKSIDEGPDSVDSVVIDINATDKDFSSNAEIRYSMAGDNNGYFQVDSITGVLSVKKVLDRENSEMTLDAEGRGVFSLDITATDQALPNNTRKSSTVRVTVTVNDISDNTPQFVDRPQPTQISEAARPASNVIQVSASDRDLSFAGKVVYNITDGNSDACYYSPCLNAGTCHEEGGGNYSCECTSGRTGKRCEVLACRAVEVTNPKKFTVRIFNRTTEGSIQKGVPANGVQRPLVTGQTIFKLIWAQCILFLQWPRKR